MYCTVLYCSKTDTDAHDPLAAPTSPRPRRAPGVRPHPHDLLQEQPVPTGMFDERAGDNAAPKLSGGLSLKLSNALYRVPHTTQQSTRSAPAPTQRQWVCTCRNMRPRGSTTESALL
jgi:hypothetical protein